MKRLEKEDFIEVIVVAIITALTIFLSGVIFVVNADESQQHNTHMTYVWNSCTDEQRMNLPIEYQAEACGLTIWEFEYMARVIEAESDRSSNLEGKILIAAVIFNRMNDNRFYNTISGVLDEPGQFSTTSGGSCAISSTSTSRWAIVEAQRLLQSGDIPTNLLYFNCIGYNYGSAYGYVGGNYFMCA